MYTYIAVTNVNTLIITFNFIKIYNVIIINAIKIYNVSTI